MCSVKKAHDHFNKGTDWRMLEHVDEFSVSLSCNDNCFTKVTLVIMLYLRFLSVIIYHQQRNIKRTLSVNH